MRKKIFAGLIVVSLLVIGGLVYMPGTFASDTAVSKVGVQVFRIEDITTKDGADAPSHPFIGGASSVLKRNADEISMELNTSELPEGTYSIWWIIDNDNDDTTGASPVPPQVEGVEIVRIATGGIVGPNGKGKFNASLAADTVPPANGATIGLNFDGNQVLNPMTARIALVMRFHGPVVPGVSSNRRLCLPVAATTIPWWEPPARDSPVCPLGTSRAMTRR